jgi:hypothetical protein
MGPVWFSSFVIILLNIKICEFALFLFLKNLEKTIYSCKDTLLVSLVHCRFGSIFQMLNLLEA